MISFSREYFTTKRYLRRTPHPWVQNILVLVGICMIFTS
uniref:Uncharacterized protein n=1 Tax=Anguilla anguilla TaxID=7936 RepID=A0A0E9P8F6_ANGAN